MVIENIRSSGVIPSADFVAAHTIGFDRMRTLVHRISASGVEMSVVRNEIALLADCREEQILRHPALMHRNEVLEAKHLTQRRLKVIVVATLSV